MSCSGVLLLLEESATTTLMKGDRESERDKKTNKCGNQYSVLPIILSRTY